MTNSPFNKDENGRAQEIAIDNKEYELQLKKNKLTRMLYAVGGSLSLALALVGFFVPGLPVTPLALLPAALFAQSSPKLYNWLLNNKLLGPRIRNYQRRKGVTRKGKMGIIAFMSGMVLLSAFVVMPEGILRYIILILGVMGGITVWFFVPTAKSE